VAEQPSSKSLIEKLGVKPGARTSVLGLKDEGFLRDLKGAGADISRRHRSSSGTARCGQSFPRVERTSARWT
jgi:hypothetical protein